ncbi:MAG: hypothetical protein HY074_03445 [Deltaproteobacteria bacterium]|nr:hypothetical protein [Deltaproteobacteria bacterium]
MVIKTLSDVSIEREKRKLTNVVWGKISDKGAPGFSQRGVITGIWKFGCALTTRHNVRAGENIWVRAKDDLGQLVLSLVGTVVWNEATFRQDGYRCEVRFREVAEAQ